MSENNKALKKLDVIKVCLCILYCYILYAELIDGSDVSLTPKLWEYMGDCTTINCNHTKGGDYFLMYWCRQLPGETNSVHISRSHKPGAHNATFTVKNQKIKV